MIRLMFLIPEVLYTIRHVRVRPLVSVVSFKGSVYHLSSDTLAQVSTVAFQRVYLTSLFIWSL